MGKGVLAEIRDGGSGGWVGIYVSESGGWADIFGNGGDNDPVGELCQVSRLIQDCLISIVS